MKLTEQVMSALTYKGLFTQHSPIFLNIYSWCEFESDILKITRNKYMMEFEIKTSKVDFQNDFLKENKFGNKHELIQECKSGLVNFSFVVPEGLVELYEIPDEYGLYYISNVDETVYLHTVRKPKNLKKSTKISDDVLLSYYKKSHIKYSNLLFGKHAQIKNRVQTEFWGLK